jgi:glutathione synthase
MKKILFYLNEEATHADDDSTMYIIREMNKYPNDFKVSYSTKSDINKAYENDVIFERFEIPIKKDFLEQLENVESQSNYDKLIINSPRSKIDLHTKHYLTNFYNDEILPETMIDSNYKTLAKFVNDLDYNVVSKPADTNAGIGIELIEKGKSIAELEDLLKMYSNNGSKDLVVQRYIDKIKEYGDKRVNVVFYEGVSGILRKPKTGSWICNVCRGGSEHPTDLSKKDYEIIEKIKPFLKENRITWAGVDIIGPYLGEINVSSPGLLDSADIINKQTKGIDAMLKGIRNYNNK